MTEICELSAVELARLIRAKDLSAREVVGAHLAADRARESRRQRHRHAGRRSGDGARAVADEALARGRDVGPLHGLPIAHKDLQPTKGIRTTFGSPIFKDFVPAEDALIVERLRARRRDRVGKTNTPEFGAGSQTFNPVFGATLNPYDRQQDLRRQQRRRGGGARLAACCRSPTAATWADRCAIPPASAASSACGRRPAACPSWPAANAWSTLSVDGPMARSVADVALLLERDRRARRAIADRARRAGGAVRRAARTRLQGRARRLVDKTWAACRSIGAFAQRVDAQRRIFESLGCVVEEAEPDFADFDEVFKTVRALAFLTGVAPRVAAHRDQVKDTILWEIDRGERLTGAEIARAEMQTDRALSPHAHFMDALRVLRAADRAGAAVQRRPAVPDRDRRRGDGDLYRLDEVVLLHLDRRQPGDLGAVRLHAGGAAGRSSDRRPASRRLGPAADGARLRTSGSRRRPYRPAAGSKIVVVG